MNFNLLEMFPFLTPMRLRLIVIAVVILGGFIFYRTQSDIVPPSIETESLRAVSIASIAELSQQVSTLSILGTISSRSQATLLAEGQGRITGVYTQLGKFENAGKVLAEIENARERAQVAQARGAYDSAKAAYDKVTKGARQEQLDILGISSGSAQQGLESGQIGAVNALLSAYAAIDDAVSKRTDSNFSNPTSKNPTFLITTNSARVASEVSNRRIALQAVLEKNEIRGQSLTLQSDFINEFAVTEKDLRDVRTYLDSVVEALNRAIESTTVSAATIASNQADASAARSGVAAAVSALAGAKDTLNGSIAALEIAKKNLQVGEAGGQSEDVRAAEGGLRSAEGALLSANAGYEKTVVRAPISGTINMLAAKTGDFANPGTALVTIANNNALEIVANITDKERVYLQVGTKVKVGESAEGVVTAIAPAIDPVTKKVEVRIALSSMTDSEFTNGSTVRVYVTQQSAVKNETIRIPITALKITPDGTFVYGVSQDDLIVAVPVKVGALRGSSIELTSPLDPLMRIITDVRGLKDGQKIEIK